MNKQKWFVILGGNMLLRGVHDKLVEFGYKIIVVDWNENPAIKGNLHIQLDVKDTVKVVSALKRLDYEIDGAFTSIDLAVPTVNAIHKAFNFIYMPDRFNKVLEKAEMREYWEKAGFFNRLSTNSNNLTTDDIQKLNLNSRIIVKPNIAASSRGITILSQNSSKEEIEKALDKAKDVSYDSVCLIEEYVEGQEFTVDMLGDNYGNVSVYGISVKYHSKNAINNRVAVKLHWNSNVYSDQVYEKIADFGINCYKSIGLKAAFGHLEVIMKKDGTITPIEIGARSSGFIASHLVTASCHVDYLKDYISVIHGEKIENKNHINSAYSSMWYGYDIPAGVTCIKKVSLSDFLPSSIKVMYFKREGLVLGKKYEKIVDDNGRDNQGYEMITGPKCDLTIDNIEKVEKEFLYNFMGKK